MKMSEKRTTRRRTRQIVMLASALGLGLSALAMLPARPVKAQTIWVGNGTNQFWDSASNWSMGVVPNSSSINVANNTAFTINYRMGTDTDNSFASTNSGAFAMLGGILNLISSFTTNGAYTQSSGTLNAASFSTSGSFSMTGGTMNVGSFTDTGSSAVSLGGGTLNLMGGTLNAATSINGGTLQNAAVAGSVLSFGNSFYSVLNNVTLGGTSGLNVNGNSTSSSFAHIENAFSFASGATFNVGTTTTNFNAGYLLFESTSGNANPTFDSAAVNATINLGNSSNGYGYLGYGNGYTSGDSLTLGSGLTIQGVGGVGYVYFGASGVSLINNGIINASIASGSLNVNTYTSGNITNNGTIEATATGSSNNIAAGSGGSITNSAGAIIQATGGGSVSVATSGTGSLINNGTIQAVNGGKATISGSVAVFGTIAASGTNSIVNLNSAFNTSQESSLTVASGGQINLQSAVANTGNTFDIASVVGANGANGSLALDGGTITGGTIANANLLSFSTNYGYGSGNILDNVTLGGTSGLNIDSYSHIDDAFNFAPGAIFSIGADSSHYVGYMLFDSTSGNVNPTFNNATVNMGSSNGGGGNLGFGNGYTSGDSLTLGSGLTVQGIGQVGYISGAGSGVSLVNNGTINCNISQGIGYSLAVSTSTNGNITNNGTIEDTVAFSDTSINPGSGGTIINNGTILATGGGTVTLSGNVAVGGILGTVTASGANSTVYFDGTYGGSQFGNVSVINGGVVALNGGTITGGTLANHSILSFGNSLSGNILDNVTLGGSSGLNVNGFNNNNFAFARIDDAFSFNSGAVFNVGTNSTNGGYICYLLFDSTSGNVNPTFDNATVNIGNGYGDGNVGFGNGYASGDSLTLGSGLTIQGAGGVGDVYIYGGPSSASGVSLINNGTINADIANNILYISTYTGGNITNNGTIEATAAGSTIPISAGVGGSLTNNGTILAANTGGVTLSGPALTNTGTMQVNSGSTLALNSTVSTQTAGTTIVSGGALTISNSNSNVYSLQGGVLYGTGTISGAINNSGAAFGAGLQGATPTTGTLALTGSYSQTAGATFSAALGGAAQGTSTGYDYFTVSGSAVLGGYLDIDLINNFVPTTGETFQIIKDNGTTGTFSNASGGTVLNDQQNYLFDIVYSASGVTIIGVGTVPEPGAGTFLVLALAPAGAAGGLISAARRRRERKG